MKRLSFLLTTMMVMMAGLLATSCQPKEDTPEKPTLSLSAQTVAVPNEGGAAAAITVTTNQGTWQAIAGADWIQTTQQGNSLIINAKPNPSNTDRTAEVGVYAGGATAQKVTVTQTAADIVLEVSPEELVIPNSGATKLVKIKSNANNWTLDIEEAKDWISINTFGDFAELVIAANEGEAREAKLYAKSATKTNEIVVKQAGVSETKYPTPGFIGYDEKANGYFPTPYDIMRYEDGHGSFLLDYTLAYPGMPSWGIPASGARVTFVTSSKILSRVTYVFNFKKEHLETITYISNMPLAEFIKSDYKDFLVNDLGFVITKVEKDLITAENEKNGFKALITSTDKGNGAVQFTGPTPPDPEQPMPMPTFDKLPLAEMFPHLFTKTRKGWYIEDVKKWEAENGGEIATEEKDDREGNIYYSDFNITDADHLSLRQYWFLTLERPDMVSKFPEHKLELMHLGYLVDNVSYVFWRDEKGNEYFTKEFKALMEKEGFELKSQVGAWYWFNKDNIVMGWRMYSYQNFAEGKQVISTQAYIDQDAAESQHMLAQDVKKLAEKWTKRAMDMPKR